MGFSGIPITADGKKGSKLLGIVTNRDTEFRDVNLLVKEVMTTEVITASITCTLAEANEVLKNSKKGKLPIVDESGNLIKMISRNDLKINKIFPNANKDQNKCLRVGAAIGTREADKLRAQALIEAGVDLIIVDSSNGWSQYQLDMIKFIKALK